jgi:hypothetical protein
MFPEEERHLFTHRKVGRRLRWFQSDNVVCFENYRRAAPSDGSRGVT